MYAQSLGYEKYFGKRGLTSAPSAKKRTEQINLDDVKANYFQKEGQKIELKLHKILGEGEGFKAEIHAKGATQTAIDKMAKAGGKIVLEEKKVFVKTEKKTESPKTEVKAEAKKPVEKKTVAKKK
jgi:ribosomal protein L15